MNIFSESNPAEEGHPAGQEGKRARRPLVRVSAGSGVMRLAVMGVVGGMLVAGLALPAVGGAGAMVVTASDQLNLRPEALEEPPLAEKTTVLDARGRQIAQFYEEYREVVPLDRVSEVMKTAIISIEDYRFYEHGPIDIEGTIRAFAKNLSSGGVAQGGSSITQQYVKQVLLNTAVTREEKEKALEASYARKLNELRYAMAVEEKYTKDEILEKYLNIAYFGAGANGIEAAAKRFFGVPAAELDLAQAATLAAAVQLPINTDPEGGRKNRQRLLERRNVVLDRMAELGKISQQEADQAKARKLGYKGTPLPGGCTASPYPYFCMYVRSEILRNPAFGKTEKARTRFLNRGGLTIKTTLDPRMQAAAERAIKKWVYASDNPVASQALIQPGTGAIKAMAASRKYGTSKARNEMSYNVVADAAHGGGVGFQPGSTFKTFTLITALKKGMKINDGLTAGAGYRAPGYASFKNCKGENIGDPTHTVTNDEGNPGFKTLQTGTWGSVNTFFLELEQRVGLCDTVQTAKSLGIKRADGLPLQEYETFTLGINEMDPVTVANAYAAIGARGKYCAPMAITQIVDRNGKVTDYRPKCRQALDPEVADATAHILAGVFTKGTMRAVGGLPGRDAAGKTGTTDNQATAWFAGFTPDLAGAVSIGDPRGSQNHKLNGVTIGGRYYGSVFGATIPGPIWKDTMLAALKGVKATPFTPINAARFGGCGQGCAPVRPPRSDEGGDDGDRGDNRGNGRGGNRGNGRGGDNNVIQGPQDR
ncbi:membrane peptidoglycan carboxypeptidase [Streptosporangium becharense]|uniref:Membrane peptidoglycan carboxypeptidase n=1 Tax=Streptosporangium becharense TaxID=1816182 RepID=A0A7W9IET1_9ACTN|nr:transglycosylase domain-containing protein [Streptosporangium becharense]MBB2912267.1 membrane peptidoglycan carboxypeptidase [Streptosporangium becharense]MBB5818814.1 membrane peptidoglycan carboxypeptidase [Streptosporangium becharense]